ncbi:MAG: FtsX-like permease family protein [Bacteroidia bacterium]|nr:FtsX-like permease family protein [Bacteroidia bacterium]
MGDLNNTFPPFAPAIANDLPEVETAVRLLLLNGRVFKNEDKVFAEDQVLLADPQFFHVFDFQLLAGDPATVLKDPHSVVVTPDLALKYYDTSEPAQVVGRTILINAEPFVVSGIVAPAPDNSHFHFNALMPLQSHPIGRDVEWNNINVSTYVLLQPGVAIDGMMAKVDDLLNSYMPDRKNHASEGVLIQPFAQALTSIHLYSNLMGEFEPTSSAATLWIFGGVAAIVLLLACVNFINLTTARSANRAKEVGVRKALGSNRVQLVRQFMMESFIMVFTATLIGLGIAELLRYPFNTITGKQLTLEVLATPAYGSMLVLFAMVIGLLAGAYPAFYLARFRPVQVLKGNLRSGFKASRLRNALVLFQFMISMVLITSTLVVQRQLTYMRERKLGFDKDHVVIVDNANRLPRQAAFMDQVQQLSAVTSLASASSRPIDDYEGMSLSTETDRENKKLVNFMRADYDYVTTMGMEVVEGRNFSRAFPTDSSALVVNETAAQFLFNENCVGKKVYFDTTAYTIVGVVRDFNFESLKEAVKPLVFFLQPNQRFMAVRLGNGDYTQAIGQIENLWKQQQADVPFSYTFVDESYKSLFREESRLGLIFGIFTVLALFIACLGLLGLAAYMTEQRSKEISVRKVLGATAAQIVMLLGREFSRIIVVAFVLAIPVAYYLMSSWLSGFAFRTTLNVWTLSAGGVLVFLVAITTVIYQSVRAALINPVESLKEE